jgi:hypothetical protein
VKQRYLSFAAYLALFATIASAQALVFHNVTLGQTESRVLTEIYWPTAPEEYEQDWGISPARFVKVWDEQGDVPFTAANDTIKFGVRPPRSGYAKSVFIEYNTSWGLDGSLHPLYLHSLPLTSFNDAPTLYVFRNEFLFNIAPNLAGFNRSFTPGEIRVLGKGGATFTLSYGQARRRYAHFGVFGLELDLGPVDTHYRTIYAVLGHQPPIIGLPIVVLEEAEYKRRIGGRSIGAYRGGTGVLYVLLKPGIQPEGYAPIVLHEAAHAHFDQLFPWNYQSSTWFTEGISEYVEAAVQRALFYDHSEYFGNELKLYGDDARRYYNAFLRGFVPWSEPVGTEYITIPSTGTPRDLWDYYRYRQDYMTGWNAAQDPDTADFGYAYGTFLVARAIREHGIEAFHAAIANLTRVDHAVTEPEEFRDLVTAALGTDFEPCNAPTYAQVEACAAQLNQFLKLPPTGTRPPVRLVESTQLQRPPPAAPTPTPTATPETTPTPRATAEIPSPTPEAPGAAVIGLVALLLLFLLFIVGPILVILAAWWLYKKYFSQPPAPPEKGKATKKR